MVLPASAWPEKDGTATNTNRQVQIGRKALRPPGEAREDWGIVRDLANRLGQNWTYSTPREIFAEMTRACRRWRTSPGSGWSAKTRSPIRATRRTSRATRSCSATASRPRPGAAAGAGAIIPPAEEPDAEYPMVLTTGRQLEHWHTGAMTRRSQVLDDLEPEAIASHGAGRPAAAGDCGRRPDAGATRRGSVELVARADYAVPTGLIFMPFCYAEAAANILTNPQLDPFGKIPEFKYCAARVEPLREHAEAAE